MEALKKRSEFELKIAKPIKRGQKDCKQTVKTSLNQTFKPLEIVSQCSLQQNQHSANHCRGDYDLALVDERERHKGI